MTRRVSALAVPALIALVTLSVATSAAPAVGVRVVMGILRDYDYSRARDIAGVFGSVEGEIPEIKAIVLSLPKRAVERIRALPFVRYVEEDSTLEAFAIPTNAPGVSKPKVSIVDCTSSVTVAAGDLGGVTFTIKNVGKVDVTVVVELRNERGSAVASTNALATPAGSSYSGKLEFRAPSTPGYYAWTLAVIDANSRSTVYDSANVGVNVVSAGSSSNQQPSFTSYTDTIGWNVRMINTTKVWSMSVSYGDASYGYHAVVQVAVVDTGIDYTHRDLSSAVVWCVVSLNATRVFYRGFDLAMCADPNGHGTHVAGIVAARLNNWGVAGVAPKSVLYAVRVLSASGRGYASDIARGIIEAVKGPDGVVGTEDDADVISMSFGGASSTVLYDAVRYAYSNGAVLVAAAGNSGGSTPVYPAAYPEVIAVGAVDRYYSVPSWSNRNPDVVAPGSGVLSTWPGDRHATASGTSMACPHVSAAVALIQAMRLSSGKQKLVPQQIMDIIRSTAVDLGLPGYDSASGYGLVDVYSAVSRSLGYG